MDAILEGLNEQQSKAVIHKTGPLLIVAGAGTGKTTILTRRINFLISSGAAAPDEILATTFTEKAAAEMEDRVLQNMEISVPDLWISTFHSFCERVLREQGLDIGLATDFKVLDQTQAWLLIRKNFEKFDLKYYKPLGRPTRFIYDLVSHFQKCKDEEIMPEDYMGYADSLRMNMDQAPVGSKAVKSKDKSALADMQEEADRIAELAKAYFTYQKILLDNNCLDFGDLIHYCLKLLRERKKIAAEYQNKFKYILVDEFQGTNYAQYELIKLLAQPRNNLAVAADDDQSIYRFRGASFNNVLSFENDYPQCQIITITKNYRSHQEILDLSYNFIQLNNPNRLEFQLNKNSEILAQSRKKGISISCFQKINKRLIAEKGSGAEINCENAETIEDEALLIGEKIKKIKERDHVQYSDFAILIRANSYAIPYCHEMERQGIPYQFLASKGLYQKPIVMDTVSFLKLLDDYHENSAMFRVLSSPIFKLDYETVVKISNFAKRKSESIFWVIKNLPLITGISAENKKIITFITALLDKYGTQAQERQPSEIYIGFLNESGCLDYILEMEKKDPRGAKESFDYLNQFLEKIKKFETNEDAPRLKEFIQQLDYELEAGEEGTLHYNLEEGGPDTVKIMTIHGAKGLEFKYVFLPGLVDKRFPSINRRDPIAIPDVLIKEIEPAGEAHLQEERRLFYVAMTRAKFGFYLSWARDYGMAREKKPSQFLCDIGFAAVPTQRKPELTYAGKLKMRPIPKMNASLKHLRPPYLSFSQMRAFDSCPLQYKFAHILKIPQRGRPQLVFGQSIHDAIYEFTKEDFLRRNGGQAGLFGKAHEIDGKISLKRLLEIYQQKWIDEWYDNKAQKKQYFESGKEILGNFHRDFYTRESRKIMEIKGRPALELDFNLKIGEEKIYGKIDRVDCDENGKIIIIDYKTGEPKEKLALDDKNQLLIYQIALQKAYGIIPNILEYYYLTNGSRIEFIGSKQELDSIEDKIKNVGKQINDSNFAATPGHQCRTCDFKDICEFREL